MFGDGRCGPRRTPVRDGYLRPLVGLLEPVPPIALPVKRGIAWVVSDGGVRGGGATCASAHPELPMATTPVKRQRYNNPSTTISPAQIVGCVGSRSLKALTSTFFWPFDAFLKNVRTWLNNRTYASVLVDLSDAGIASFRLQRRQRVFCV